MIVATYKVTLNAPAPAGEVRVEYMYVSGPDGKSGYQKAKAKAEAKMAKAGKPQYRATDVRCIG